MTCLLQKATVFLSGGLKYILSVYFSVSATMPLLIWGFSYRGPRLEGLPISFLYLSVCVCASITAFHYFTKDDNDLALWTFAVIAILYNPVTLSHLWGVVHLTVAVILFFCNEVIQHYFEKRRFFRQGWRW